jgi:hypothetical protein
MFSDIFTILQLMSIPSFCRDYVQTRDLMTHGKNKMVLSWVVEEDMFFFKLSGMTRGYMGLAFSYSNLPLDGVVTGVDDEGDLYVLDLHLDYAGKLYNGFDSILNHNRYILLQIP